MDQFIVYRTPGMGLSTPAFVATIAYVIAGLTILFPFRIPLQNGNGEIYIVNYDIGQRILILLMLTIPTILSVYSLNCMMVGHCDVWSHVVSALTVLWALMFVLLAYIYTVIN